MRIYAIVFGLRHGGPTRGVNRRAIVRPHRADRFPFVVTLDPYLVGWDPGSAGFCTVLIVRLGQNHPLTEKLRGWLITADNSRIAHQFVPETEIQQVHHRMFYTTDVMIYR